MEFILDNTGPTGENSITESQLELLLADIKNITDNVNTISNKLNELTADYNNNVTANNSAHTTINSNINELRTSLNTLAERVTALNNTVTTTNLNATKGSIANLKSTSAEIDSLKLNSTLKADIDTDNVKAKKVTATTGNITDLNSDEAKIKKLKVDDLSIDLINTKNVDADSIVTANANIDNLKITDKIELNGIDLNQLDLKLTGWTNGYLHKMEVKADGVVLIKTPSSSIVISPGNISSNYNKLYAAYEADGIWNVYIDSDLDCQAIVIGEAEINSSLVLKTSVRKNADSNGQPNISNTVKVAVVSTLPKIGQRNMIYVVLGDCAYYCDGQYFYEMASKKRG